METNHKELFDQVIGEENTNEIPTNNEEEETIEDKMHKGCIPLKSCTGAMFFIDPTDPKNAELFAPENLIKHISNFSEQEDALTNIYHNLLCHSQVPMHEFSEYIDGLVPQLEKSLNGFGMTIDMYTEQNPNLSTYEKALYITFDLFSFTKTLNHFLVTMAMATIPAPQVDQPGFGFTNDGVFNDGEVDIPSTADKYEGNKGYKVYGHIQSDNSVEILQVIEEDTDPSDMLVVHDEPDDELDGVISLYTIASSEESAVLDAKIVFKGYIRDMLETDIDKAYRVAEEMKAESGLLG